MDAALGHEDLALDLVGPPPNHLWPPVSPKLTYLLGKAATTSDPTTPRSPGPDAIIRLQSGADGTEAAAAPCHARRDQGVCVLRDVPVLGAGFYEQAPGAPL